MRLTVNDGSPSTRSLIAATALALFQEHGYNATSLRMIADRMSVTKAALYYHYPAKEHLVIELTRPFFDGLAVLLDQTGNEPDLSARQDRMLEGYADVFLAHHRVVRFLAHDVGAQQHPDVGARVRTLVSALHGAIAGPDAAEEDLVRVRCALGAVESIAGLSPSAVSIARPIVLSCARAALRSARTVAVTRGV